MSFRYPQAGKCVAVVTLASLSMAFQPAQAPVVPSAPPAATPAPGPSGPTLNIFGVPVPKKGKPYRFNLCTGQQFDSTDISRVCNPADAAKTVSGAAPGKPIVFRLAGNSFLPPGCGLDGNGVIACAADANLTKLKSVRICAIQVGAIGSNFACTGQEVGFNKLNIRTPQPQKAVQAGGGGGAGTALKVGAAVVGIGAGGYFLKNALDDIKALDAGGASTTSTTTTPASTGSRFAGTYDFSYVSPLGPQNLNRYWTVRTDGSIVSSDGAVSGSVNDAGTARFTAPCWTTSGGTATWNGTLVVGSVKSGSGTFTCALNNINGGTWRVDNGR